MADTDVNTLNLTGEEEPITTDAPIEATEAGEEIPVSTEPPVDETPDPEALKADIERLNKERKKAEEKALYWRQQKAKERADYFKGEKREKTPAPAEISLKDAPRSADFEDYDSYIDAKTKYEVQKARLQWDREAKEREENQEFQRREEQLNSKLQRGFQKYDDFEDVVLAETVPITPLIKDCLGNCENPEDVAYYLGKNRPILIKLSHMTPLSAAREIARIEIEINQQTPSAAAPAKATKAPKPINPIGSAGTVEKDPEDMTQKEYEQYRRNQGAKPY